MDLDREMEEFLAVVLSLEDDYNAGVSYPDFRGVSELATDQGGDAFCFNGECADQPNIQSHEEKEIVHLLCGSVYQSIMVFFSFFI